MVDRWNPCSNTDRWRPLAIDVVPSRRLRIARLFIFSALLPTGPSFSTVDTAFFPSENTNVRLALRYPRPEYKNYAIDLYENYPDHIWKARVVGPQIGIAEGVERPRAFFDLMGNHVTTGYDLYTWEERRQPEQRFGSALFKDWPAWRPLFTNVAVASDGYGSWGYHIIVGDGLIARLSPLTLSKTDLYGLRMDFSTPHVKLTGIGSRIARPNRETSYNADVGEVDVDHSTMLLGSRAQLDVGLLSLGVNGANLHSYNSVETDNSIRGRLRRDQPSYSFIAVRVSDDAPDDGKSGATVQNVGLVINGDPRSDLQPHIFRTRRGTRPQAGRTLPLTGQFIASAYTRIEGPSTYYRNQELPLYADFLYRLDHDAGVDVSNLVRVEGMLAEFPLVPPGGVLNAEDNTQYVFLFDLRNEPYIESVAVEAVLGNDYFVEWAGIYLNKGNDTAERYEDRFRSTFYRPALRAKGRVEDMTNVVRRRFQIAENTAIFTYSADLKLALPWIDINAEYARSALYSRYPAHFADRSLVNEGPRFKRRGGAYFFNGIRRFERGIVGFEGFTMDSSFATDMPTYIKKDFGYITSRGRDPLALMTNDTVIWSLVQDNEDGDRWPDFFVGNVLGSGGSSADSDGVFPGQDEDGDGLVATDKNFNGIPDFEETFMLFDVEPNEYVYGLDRNNNDEPDHREDDWDADYPYDADQRGYHLFGSLGLGLNWSLGLGRYNVRGLKNGGRNRSDYALLTYHWAGLGRVKQLFFESNLRRVQDDIPDAHNQYTRGRGHASIVRKRDDPLHYQDSEVGETYFEGNIHPLSGLRLVQKLRLRFNWQRGGQLKSRQFQRSRRLDFTAYVSRLDYTKELGKLSVVPQFKFLYLRLRDSEIDRDLRSEHRIVSILKVSYSVMPKTTIQLGLQGWGPLPYRVKSRTQSRDSLKQRTLVFTTTNRTRYLGYDLITIAGLSRDRLIFDDPAQRFRDRNSLQLFVRAALGFAEFGRLL